MSSVNYNNYIVFSDDQVTCTSPTPERETYFKISFGRKSLGSKVTNHIKAAKSAVRKKLITATFGAIQVQALEAILHETNTTDIQ